MRRFLQTVRLLVSALLLGGAALRAADAVSDPAVPAGPFTRDQLVAALTRDLAGHFKLEGDLQLELLRAWTPPARVAAAWNLTVLEYPSMPASSMLVRCQVSADGETVAETTFVLRASLWRDAWVTRQPVVAGDTFDPTQLDVRRVDLFRDREALPAAVGDRTFVFTRGVGAGRQLTWRDLNRRPLVKKGELVEVTAVEGQLNITMKGLAMENGAQGDTVTIRNPESRKDFSALVIDENHVQVRF